MEIDEQTPLKAGWLSKRGPTKQFKWQRRWCVLLPDRFLYYEDDPANSTIDNKVDSIDIAPKPCGRLPIKPDTRAWSFADHAAPGESAKYTHEKSFGFCLDVTPDEGPNRRLYYFDAGSSESLRSWMHAIDSAVATIGIFRPGDVVKVSLAFKSDSDSETLVNKGESGTILRFDEDGDALIDFHQHNLNLWVFSKKFSNLRKIVAPLEKTVMLELLPQDAFIMHWAIRVGAGPTSLCYEFEADGIEIGRQSKLDKGYPLQTQQLQGLTYKAHNEIKAWAVEFGRQHTYTIDGDTFGGSNCQDFSVKLCEYLRLDTTQLPWKQAHQVKFALGAGAIAADLAMGTGMLAAGTDMLLTAGATIGGVAMAPEVLVLAGSAAAIGYAYGMYTETEDDTGEKSMIKS